MNGSKKDWSWYYSKNILPVCEYAYQMCNGVVDDLYDGSEWWIGVTNQQAEMINST